MAGGRWVEILVFLNVDDDDIQFQNRFRLLNENTFIYCSWGNSLVMFER